MPDHEPLALLGDALQESRILEEAADTLIQEPAPFKIASIAGSQKRKSQRLHNWLPLSSNRWAVDLALTHFAAPGIPTHVRTTPASYLAFIVDGAHATLLWTSVGQDGPQGLFRVVQSRQ